MRRHTHTHMHVLKKYKTSEATINRLQVQVLSPTYLSCTAAAF